MRCLKTIKKCSGILTAALFACAVTFTAIADSVPVEVDAAAVSRPKIERHHQYLYFYPMTTETYLTRLDDGGYMTFRLTDKYSDDYYDSPTPYKVEIYDPSLKCVSIKRIKAELPRFGGFYADQNGYYILTGQENPKQSASVECFRLTKYDKDWKKVGSCGFKDCYTVTPFSFGGASMDSSGNYLVIKTNRSMYKTEDGGNHQTSITLTVDTSTMKGIWHPNGTMHPGYVSHSWNQYVKIDNNHIISADHGDGGPRAMAVCYYKDPISSEQTEWKRYIAFPIGGGLDEEMNVTLATLGGLEISDSSYIIVGSSIDQSRFPADINDFEDENLSMNIFVSTVDKSSGETQTKWLTTAADAMVDYDNPYIVKINDDSFAVIWTRINKENKIYYAFIDGKGNLQGSVKSASGILSDCQPILSGNEIVWYTENGLAMVDNRIVEYAGTRFYSINVNDKSFSSKVLYDVNVNQPKNGTASLSCLKAPAGAEVAISAVPDEGYEFSYILVNGKRVSGDKFTMPEAKTSVTVNFKKEGSPNLDETVNIGDFSYQVTNSDTEGSGTVMLTGIVNPMEAVVIPPTIDINGYTYKVNKVAARAFFENMDIKTVYIGANVAVIDTNAFFGCPNLVKASGGAGLKVIGQNAFARCPKLSTFIITSKVLYKIGPQAFYKDSRLKTVYVKNTTKLTKSGVKKSLKGSSVKTVKVKKSKVYKYRKFFKKSNSGRKVKVKK